MNSFQKTVYFKECKFIEKRIMIHHLARKFEMASESFDDYSVRVIKRQNSKIPKSLLSNLNSNAFITEILKSESSFIISAVLNESQKSAIFNALLAYEGQYLVDFHPHNVHFEFPSPKSARICKSIIRDIIS
jgi:hypothetical protein